MGAEQRRESANEQINKVTANGTHSSAQHSAAVPFVVDAGQVRCKVKLDRTGWAVHKRTNFYTHESFPSPMASKLFPLRVRRSSNTCTSSSFINFSDGGGDPSTQPFQPFRAAGRFLRCRGARKSESRTSDSSKSESSSGVCGRLDDVREVLDEMEGPGVVGGDEGIGGGVTETERCVVARRKTGREPQAEDEDGSKRKSLE